MKIHFSNYYMPSDEEINQLWRDGIFILDTNVLLKLYCYTEAARIDFLKALKDNAEHLWLPNQVAFEYQKNRLIKIDEQMSAYDDIKDLIDKHLQFDKLPNSLDNYKYHPYIDKDKILTQISRIKEEIESIKKDLDKTRDKHPDLMHEDDIRDEITRLFDGRVGEPCNKAKLDEIYKYGESRYKNNIPPGYKDNTKKDSTIIIGKDEERLIVDKYGDLIIWFEIIEKAKEDQKPVIFVTDDSKEDWWWEFKGQKFGPRPELVHEFKSKTGMLYHMYSAAVLSKFLHCL
ncbi:MAG TPA: PIN-like domain-containing protein [Rectinema sp.]|nr:PIN-like domain-containing protein [Rectinema sp.]